MKFNSESEITNIDLLEPRELKYTPMFDSV